MPNFIMTIGIPGCGKSTYAKELAAKGYHIHSSDDIREEFNFSDTECFKTFEILHKRVLADLKNGIDVVYDATNMSRKNRINTLSMLKNIPCHKTAALFIVPVNVCMDRNSRRDRTVPDYVYDRMLKSFNVPMLDEGWDEIKVIKNSRIATMIDWYYMDNFDQENNHHDNTVGQHMRLAEEYIKSKTDRPELIKAARYHDIGKPITKTYVKPNGKTDGQAHYYGHENYGAYLYLETVNNVTQIDLYIAALINWHMAPYTRWNSEKCFNKDKLHLSEQFINDIMLIHEADANAH